MDADARRGAIALRFVPYSDNGGTLDPGWTVVMAAILLIVAAASVYLVYVLEILKFRRLTRPARRLAPDSADAEIDADTARRMETGEFDAVRRETEEFQTVEG